MVSWYAFLQLLAVVALSTVMQVTDLAYWPGVALWALLLATTVLTALWLEGRFGLRLLQWEALRLLGCLAVLAWLQPGGGGVALVGAYVAGNILFLGFLARRQRGGVPPSDARFVSHAPQ